MSKKREEIEKKDKWNVEAIFDNDQLWEKEFNLLKEEVKKIILFKEKLNESSLIIKKMIETDIEISRRLEKLFIYAHMKHDEDTKNEKYKSFYDISQNLYLEYNEISSWIIPELLKIDENIIKQYINSEDLSQYKFHIEKILKSREHTLSENEEKILSMVSNALTTSQDGFRSLNDGDLKFGKIIDKNNNELELTHSMYMVYLMDNDRDIRKKAFVQYHNKFDEFPMTMASLLHGKVKEHVFYAKARNFSNTLECSLFYKNIDTSVYHNLINTVKKRIGSLHNYLKFRKHMMGLKELHLYDIYVPFIEGVDIKMNYNEAKDILLNSIKILGDEYYSTLKDGLENNGWVDKYENEYKRSGAYSTGCYDTMPYILMNYNGTLNAARTLAHEAGHSIHSFFSNKHQSPIYASYPIFLAEIASTFNEELFNNHLINSTDDKKTIAYLINSRLEEIRATFFRQTMFAEFELLIHNLVETGVPLTYQLLKKEYRKLNEFYFGNEVIIDDQIEIEWARIPHFYYNYYVYQYATGISASISLYKKVINGSKKEKDDYLNFLKSGFSKYPLEILNNAGVDITTPEPVERAIDYFDELLLVLKNNI